MAKRKEINIEFENQKILPINMEHEVQKSFMEYAMSVLTDRAVPDARDGMKPGQRRVLYAMFEDNLTHDKQFKKSATTVGNVLGRYHPHGDSSVYGTMVRMAQDFSYRYLLVEGHGNFGSVDGDPPAAYRYTESRLSKLSEEMMRDIDKNVIPWAMNFDNTRKEPVVLPSRFPNLLVNGSMGIAVGYTTDIPPHNLGEVIDGTIYFMDHPDAGLGELMQYIKGPDFPTGGIVYGTSGIIEAYTTGRGRIMVRGKAEIDEEEHHIIITEIPYMVQKSELIVAMSEQVKDKKVEGVTDIRDESDKDGLRIVIECKKEANLQIILNQFYKYTELEHTYSVCMLALVDKEPKVLNLREILRVYVAHQISVVTNRVKFDLDKAQKEAHINEGYKTVIDNVDEVVSIIRKSSDTQSAKENLKDRFDLSDEQAQAIVQMPLGRLSGLERQKILDKLAELYRAIDEYTSILADKNKVREIIKEDLLAIKEKFGDARRTTIEEAENEIVYEDLIERHKTVITLTHAGYIKRQPADTYSVQRRGGKGIIGMATKEEDYIERVSVVDSHSILMLFTDMGRVFQLKAYRIPEASRTAKGSNIVNILDITSEEKITAMFSVPDFSDTSLTDEYDDRNYLIMITQNGIIKKSRLIDFKAHRRGAKIAINLDEDDRLIFVGLTHGESDILIATKRGLAARFDEEKIRVMGRNARGVKGIRLNENDKVAGACLIEKTDEWKEENTIITVTENGFGKRISSDSFAAKGRGIKGSYIQRYSEKTGELCGIMVVREDEDVLMITNDGMMIRIPVKGIPIHARTARGVILMRMSSEKKIVNFALVDSESDEDNDFKVEELEGNEDPDEDEDEIELSDEETEEEEETPEEESAEPAEPAEPEENL